MVTTNTEIKQECLTLAGGEEFPSYVDFATPKKSVAIPYSNIKALIWTMDSGEKLVIESHGPTIKIEGSKLMDLKSLLKTNRVCDVLEHRKPDFAPAGSVVVSKIIFEGEHGEGEKGKEFPARGSAAASSGEEDQGLDG